MKRILFLFGILLASSVGLTAQESGNAKRMERANASSYGKDESVLKLATGDLASLESTNAVTQIYFLEATVLMNLKADEYIASFGVQAEGKTSLESEQQVDAKIDELKRKLAIMNLNETFVDFISQIPYFEFDATSKTATEKFKGYKTAKNISIRYKERNMLRQITNAANSVGIFDLIKIDFVVNDFSQVRSKLMQEAIKVIKNKEQNYASLGISLKSVGVATEKFKSYSPDDLYADYTAYESGTATGFKRVVEKSKTSTSYYKGFDGNDFDLTINPNSLEPNIQAVMYLKVKYLPTVTPQTICCSDQKPK